MKKKTAAKPILTPADMTALINKMKVVFPTREEVEHIVDDKLDKKLRFIPTTDLFLTRMDKLSAEIQAVRDEQAAHVMDHSRINDRFDRIDLHLGITTTE